MRDLGPAYELRRESLEGRPVMRAHGDHPASGFRILLTFPVGGGDLREFKAHAARARLSMRGAAP